MKIPKLLIALKQKFLILGDPAHYLVLDSMIEVNASFIKGIITLTLRFRKFNLILSVLYGEMGAEFKNY